MNRLAIFYSLYLLRHKNNPVDWYPRGVIPSSNAIMASKLLLLSRYFSNKSYFNLAEHIFARTQELIVRDSVWLTCWVDFALQYSSLVTEIYILGENYKNVVSEFRKHYFEPHLHIFGAENSSNLDVFFGKDAVPNQRQIYVCQESVCQLPVNTLDEAIQILKAYEV